MFASVEDVRRIVRERVYASVYTVLTCGGSYSSECFELAWNSRYVKRGQMKVENFSIHAALQLPVSVQNFCF